MSAPAPSPPRWSRRLLEWAARRLGTRELPADAADLFVERAQRYGPRAARRWYRRQVWATAGHLLLPRPHSRKGSRLDWLGSMRLDLRLAIRLLLKHPGLTVVATLGMAVAIGIGTASFAAIENFANPTLPLQDGERVVAIRNLDPTDDQRRASTHLHDLEVWREELGAVEDLGAYRIVNRNLVTPDGVVEPTRVAEVTASAFRVALVAPLLGRYVLETDQQGGAPPVVVLGHDLWQRRFAGDSNVVGRILQLGTAQHMVIGVMPPGFAFPVNNRVWTPLQLAAADYPVGQAPAINVFGRLAPGVGMAEAEAQLTILGRHLAAAWPRTHGRLRPEVISYPRMFAENPTQLMWVLYVAQMLVSMILVVVGINVAALVYARTATRTAEIAVRTALGASRARVVMQLVAEALVMSTTAAAAGLLGAYLALRQVNVIVSRIGGEAVPFWWRFELSPGTVFYAVVLAVVAALIVGVLPALNATGRRVHSVLKVSGSGGSGLQLGRTWTVLIVAQVGLAMTIMPLALRGVSEWRQASRIDHGVPTAEFLTASLHLDPPPGADAAAGSGASADLYAALQLELARRLEEEPGISRVVFTTAVPGAEPDFLIEVDEPSGQGTDVSVGSAGHDAAHFAAVEADFFRVLEIPTLAGRSFDHGDFADEARSVIVNRGFVDRVLGGAQPLGRRVRYARRGDGEAGPWLEIVGVVADFPAPVGGKAGVPAVYRPMVPGQVTEGVLLARGEGGSPGSLEGRLRQIALELDPMLRVATVTPLNLALREQQKWRELLIALFALLCLSGLLLSAAGISALMSFTVARRRREIGIRSALGAQPRRVLAGVLARASLQVGIGFVLGLGLAGVLDRFTGGELLGPRGPLYLLAAAVLMTAMGTFAAWSPARRGLNIHPTEALRAD